MELTIKFIKPATVYDHKGEVEQAFAVDDVVTLNEASANHWVKRGAAEITEAKPKKRKK